MAPNRPDEESPAPSPGPGQAVSGRHSLREQDVLWARLPRPGRLGRQFAREERPGDLRRTV